MFMRLSLLIFLFLPFALISQSDIEARLLRFNKKIESTKKFTAEKKFNQAFRSVKSAKKILEKIPSQPDSLQADWLMAKGLIYFEKNEYDSAEEYLEKALTILGKPGGNYLQLKECFLKVGLLNIRNKDYSHAVSMYEKEAGIFEKYFGENDLILGKIYYYLASYYGFTNYEFDKAIPCFEKAINLFQKKEEDQQLVLAYTKLANVYNWIWNFEKSTPLSHKAYTLSLKTFGKENKNTGEALLQLGMAYNGLQKFDESINYYLASLDVFHKVFEDDNPVIGHLYNLISTTHYNQKSYDKAIAFMEKHIKFLLLQEYVDPAKLGRTYVSFSMMLQKNKDYSAALDYLQKGILIFKNPSVKSVAYDMSFAYMNRSTLYLSLDSLSQAEASAKTSLKILEADPQLNVEVRNHRNLAEIYKLRKNFNLSETYYDKIFERFKYKRDGDFLKIANKTLLFEVLSLNAKMYADWGKNKNDQTYLNRGVALFDQSLRIYDHIRNNQFEADSKSILLKEGVKTYEGYIDLLNELFSQTNDPKFIDQIFDLSERSKASLLHKALQHSNALNFAGIPDSLTRKERALKLEVNTLDKERESWLLKGVLETDPGLLALSAKLFGLRQKYQNLEKDFEVNYPEYFQLKFDLNTIGIQEIQQKILSVDQTLIEYFVGEKSIFIAVINQEEAKLVKIKKDFPLAEWVKDFRKSNEANSFQMEIKTYGVVAHNLYNKLVAPIAADLKGQLIIIPDGALGYLPFEALLVEPVSKIHRFKKHHFLIRDKQISYSYSATLLDQLKKREHKTATKKRLLAFAPFFYGDTTILNPLSRFVGGNELENLRPLPNTGEEVYGIQKVIGGDVYYKNEATEENFLERAHDYKLIHLATHGKANDQAGDFSYLAFTIQKDSIENEIIYMRDLYNLQLNADMVVLSACETGIGELQKGEGIISLARGFTYAGAKSIITSLWSVEDKCTKDIMISFYKYLDQGLTKDAALRQAKLDYINDEQTTHVDAHPFYWSPFISIGDMSKL